MATFYGVNATSRDNTTPRGLIPVGEVAGRVRMAFDSYTLTADLSAADVIHMMEIPAGARVVDAVMKFADLDSGSSGTLDVGWAASSDAVVAADTTGIFSAADVHTAADVFNMKDQQAAPTGLFKQFASKVRVKITVNGDTNATSGTISLAVYYVID